MIEHLKIKNVALIEEVDIELCEGLNILSGETGAGKSMIIDSINFMLGERTRKDFIRNGEDYASVDGLVSVSDARVIADIREMGVDIADDNLLLISRGVYANGRSVCKINGKNVTLGMLRDISGLLVDVHGQHEHQSLLDESKQMLVLDKFCGESVESAKNTLATKVRRYREILKAITDISGNEREREARAEFLRFQAEEIKQADLKENEEELLEERQKVLSAAERLSKNVNEIIRLLYAGDKSATEKLSTSAKLLKEVAALDSSQRDRSERLTDISIRLEDLSLELSNYRAGLRADPDELNETENRLHTIFLLKRKYGPELSDVMAHYKKISAELDAATNAGAELARLNAEKKSCGEEILELCRNVSAIRKANADVIKARLAEILTELGMKNAVFDIAVEKKNAFSASGYDKVEFLISPNAGEPVKPLAAIASGGEISRVMLALKTVLADADSIGTFIFDEIDTGVSGRTAQQVAEKLALIARRRQLICITHLPQIAAMADKHFLIEKSAAERNGVVRTSTSVYGLDNEGITRELARLLGGARITDATLTAAAEMKVLAGQRKEEVR